VNLCHCVNRQEIFNRWRRDLYSIFRNREIERPEDTIGKGLEEVWVSPCVVHVS